MTIAWDGSLEMWSKLSLEGSLLVACAYGIYRREYTRVWPILLLGLILNIVTQVWLAPKDAAPSERMGLYTGFLLYPLYCMVAAVGGIMIRVVAEWLVAACNFKKPTAPTGVRECDRFTEEEEDAVWSAPAPHRNISWRDCIGPSRDTSDLPADETARR